HPARDGVLLVRQNARQVVRMDRLRPPLKGRRRLIAARTVDGPGALVPCLSAAPHVALPDAQTTGPCCDRETLETLPQFHLSIPLLCDVLDDARQLHDVALAVCEAVAGARQHDAPRAIRPDDAVL